jgi:hypothetical protein
MRRPSPPTSLFELSHLPKVEQHQPFELGCSFLQDGGQSIHDPRANEKAIFFVLVFGIEWLLLLILSSLVPPVVALLIGSWFPNIVAILVVGVADGQDTPPVVRPSCLVAD